MTTRAMYIRTNIGHKHVHMYVCICEVHLQKWQTTIEVLPTEMICQNAARIN